MLVLVTHTYAFLWTQRKGLTKCIMFNFRHDNRDDVVEKIRYTLQRSETSQYLFDEHSFVSTSYYRLVNSWRLSSLGY